MNKAVEQAFGNLNTELLVAMSGNGTSLPDSILYANLASKIQDVHHTYGKLIGKIGQKKSASGVAITESGSKEGCPRKDDSLTHAFSLDDKSKDVKPLAFMIISVSPSQMAQVEISGSSTDLATCLAKLISCLSQAGVDISYICAGIAAGLNDTAEEDLKC